ncbi:hypothetical protein ACIQUO_04110 [Streptomyces albogriseolus]|uniref:hypothetical protein n=1 Tax=Streptomyces TaxID=1883 RepID=UPI000A97FD66|nr:hypothetical protein [Streptomyces sp. F-7]
MHDPRDDPSAVRCQSVAADAMSVSKSSCFAELGTGPYPGEKATREKTEAACRAAP